MILLLGVWFLLGICLQGGVAKSHFRNDVEFGQGLITTKLLFLEQEVSLVPCLMLLEQIYLEKCIANEEISNGILCKAVTFGSYAPTAVWSSIFPDRRGIFHRGEVNLQLLQRNNFTDLTYAGSLDGYMITQNDGFRQAVFPFLPYSDFVFWPVVSGNVYEVNAIRYRDVVYSLCVHLPWNFILILLFRNLVFGRFHSRRGRYTMYTGNKWSRRKVY